MTTTTQQVQTIGEKPVSPLKGSKQDVALKTDIEMQKSKSKGSIDLRVRFAETKMQQSKKTTEDTIDHKKAKRKSKRMDRLGNSIKKGSRKHHISFKDEVLGQAVAQVFLVQSYKEYNRMEEKADGGCRCVIF